MINELLILLCVFNLLNAAASELSLSSPYYKVQKVRVGGPKRYYKVLDGVCTYPNGDKRVFCGIVSMPKGSEASKSSDKNFFAAVVNSLKKQLSNDCMPDSTSTSVMEKWYDYCRNNTLGYSDILLSMLRESIPNKFLVGRDPVAVDCHIFFQANCEYTSSLDLFPFQQNEIIAHAQKTLGLLSLEKKKEVILAAGSATGVFHRAPFVVIDLQKLPDYLQAQQKLTISEEDAEANRY